MNHQLATAKNNGEGQSVNPATPFQTHKVLKPKSDHTAAREDGVLRLNARIASLNSSNEESVEVSIAKDMPPENDAGNARLFLDRFGGELRFVAAFNCWFIWSGTRWKRDEDGGIQRLAVKFSMALMSAAAKIVDHDKSSMIAKRSIRLGNAAKMNSMLELAKCDQHVVVPHSQLDSNQWLLGVENGVIELQTGTFRNGRREDLVTKVAGCPYDSKAEAPLWEQFLRQVFANDDDLISYVQKLVGYTLTGCTREQVFLFLYGAGANGKTTFIETIAALLGDYGQRASQTLLVACEKRREPMNEIARLRGARFVVGSETRQDDRLAENLIKDMTGGDTLTGRFLYREAFDFIPTLKLWMFGNHCPEIRGTDFGIWRRVRLIPFYVRIAEGDRDYGLQDKLRRELPGVLNWALRGCLLWQREGLTPPDVVISETAEYQQDEDLLRDFLDEAIEDEADSHVTHANLYRRYISWCDEKCIRFRLQSRTLAKRLRERPLYRQVRTGKAVRWVGMKLK